jgi:hypothetical protein
MFRKQVSRRWTAWIPHWWPQRWSRSSELEEGPGHRPNPRFLCPSGSVWVAVRGEDSSESAVIRIDPATDEVVARIPVDAVPGWDVGGGSLEFDDGTLCVVGGNDAGGVVERIDTTTNRVVMPSTSTATRQTWRRSRPGSSGCCSAVIPTHRVCSRSM